MKFIDDIFSWIWDRSVQLKDWADSIWTWIPGHDWFHDRLYDAADLLWNLLTPIAHFGDLLDDWAERIKDILSWENIVAMILLWIPNLEDIRDWFLEVISNILAIVNSWWEAVSVIVQGWIAALGEALQALIDNLATLLANLQAAWDDFKTRIPTIDEIILWWSDWWAQILIPLTTWWNERLAEVNTLINDTIKTWFPFYDELVSLWSEITEFFTSPLDFLLDRFADWFFGPEE